MRALLGVLSRYSIALSATILAFLFSLVLVTVSPRIPFAFFLAAVIIASLQGGLKPGLAATALSASALLLEYSLLAKSAGGAANQEYLALWIGFVCVGLLASYLGEQYRRSAEAVRWVQLTLASVGDAVIFADSMGNVTYLNPVAQSLTGWRQDEAVHKPLDLVFRAVGEDSRELAVNQFLKIFREGKNSTCSGPALLLSKNGTEKPIDLRVAAIRDTEGALQGIILMFYDATQRRRSDRALRQSEEHHRALVAGMPVGILWLDAKGHCQYANRACHSLGGFTAEESLGEGWARCLHPEDRSLVLARWTDAVEAGKEFRDEVRLRPLNGEAPWVLFRATPMHAEDGRLLGYAATLEDVTRQKEIEESLRQTRRAKDSLEKHRAELEQCLQERAAELNEVKHALSEAIHARKQVEDALHRGHARIQALEQQSAQLAQVQGQLHETMQAREDARQALRNSEERLRALEEQSAQLADSRRALQDTAQARLSAEEELLRLRQELARSQEERLAELVKADASLQEAIQARRRAEQTLQESQACLHETQQRALELEKANAVLQEEVQTRGQTEEKLRHEKEFVDGLIQHSGDGIFAFDREQRFTLWNPAMERISGSDKSQALGRLFFDLFPDWKERAEEKSFAETLQGRSHITLTEFKSAENGEVRLYEISYAPLFGRSTEVIGGIAVVRERAGDRAAAATNGQRLSPSYLYAHFRPDDTFDWLSYN
jgi:PAS domain S-box-containing protein